jgi:hypothetical protein
MWLVFCFIGFIILGIIFSKIEITLKNIVLNQTKQDFLIELKILFFGFIKICTVNFKNNEFIIYGKRISYKQILSSKEFKRLKLDFKKTNFNEVINNFKKLKPKISIVKFLLKIGFGEMFLTQIFIVIISTILPLLTRLKIFEINFKKIDYRILPEFNKLGLEFSGKLNIEFKTFEIIKLLVNKKIENKKYSLVKPIRIEN